MSTDFDNEIGGFEAPGVGCGAPQNAQYEALLEPARPQAEQTLSA